MREPNRTQSTHGMLSTFTFITSRRASVRACVLASSVSHRCRFNILDGWLTAAAIVFHTAISAMGARRPGGWGGGFVAVGRRAAARCHTCGCERAPWRQGIGTRPQSEKMYSAYETILPNGCCCRNIQRGAVDITGVRGRLGVGFVICGNPCTLECVYDQYFCRNIRTVCVCCCRIERTTLYAATATTTTTTYICERVYKSLRIAVVTTLSFELTHAYTDLSV